MSSSPIRDVNDLPEDPSLKESESQSQTQGNQANVPSSPLFFATSSSNPQSEANAPNTRSQRRDVSSPLNYSSSVHHTSDAARGNEAGSSRLRSDRLTSDVDRIIRRHNRSDLHDTNSSPMRRRIFTESSAGHSDGVNVNSSSSQFNTDPMEGNDEPVRVIWGYQCFYSRLF